MKENEKSMPEERKLYYTADLERLFGLSRPTIYRWMSIGAFPKALKLGPIGRTRIAWRIEDIDEWFAQRPELEFEEGGSGKLAADVNAG